MELEYAEMEREFAENANAPEYWFTAYKIELIKSVHDYLDGLPEIGKVLSLVSPVRVAENMAEQELGAFELAILYTKIPPNVKKTLIEQRISFLLSNCLLRKFTMLYKPEACIESWLDL